MNEKLKGLGVALVTPFAADGSIDWKALERVIEFDIRGPVDYFVIMGTTAETPTLQFEERRELLVVAKHIIAGRRPIVVGIGSNSTDEVVRMIEQTSLEGVDAVLSVTPYYNKPNQRGLYQHFKAVANVSPVPVVLYNVPSRTGVNMEANTVLRLANESENIVAVKEASGNMEQIEQIIDGAPSHFCVISGDDSLALRTIGRGGAGLISVAANAFPRYFALMIEAQRQGRSQAAETMWTDIAPIVKMLFTEGSPAGVKAAMNIEGLIENRLRLPLVEVSETLYKQIGDEIKRVNLPLLSKR